jgi:hypothetical protein
VDDTVDSAEIMVHPDFRSFFFRFTMGFAYVLVRLHTLREGVTFCLFVWMYVFLGCVISFFFLGWVWI